MPGSIPGSPTISGHNAMDGMPFSGQVRRPFGSVETNEVTETVMATGATASRPGPGSHGRNRSPRGLTFPVRTLIIPSFHG